MYSGYFERNSLQNGKKIVLKTRAKNGPENERGDPRLKESEMLLLLFYYNFHPFYITLTTREYSSHTIPSGYCLQQSSRPLINWDTGSNTLMVT